MDTALVQRRPELVNPCLSAAHGLGLLGYRVEWFTDDEWNAGLPSLSRETLVVGGVAIYLQALDRLGIGRPSHIALPSDFWALARRQLRITTLGDVRRGLAGHFFLKPLRAHKLFTGRLVRSPADLAGIAHLDAATEVLISDPLNIVAEHRVFVLHGDVIGCQPYRGDPLAFPDASWIREATRVWRSAPAAWALDVAVTLEGTTTVIEVNDGHSMGDYGLSPPLYARFLEARWCELTGATPIP